MNVFVLSTGRCGSTTFARACAHITNFTAGHETRVQRIGDERLAYPDNHIESDHYLSWFLGRLDERYGDNAYYVHLMREPEKVASSWATWSPHWIGSLARAYQQGILVNTREPLVRTARDQIETVNANIRLFLAGKTHRMEFRVENAQDDWAKFWRWIGAEGDYGASLAEWRQHHNASQPRLIRLVRDSRHKAQRVYRTFVPH